MNINTRKRFQCSQPNAITNPLTSHPLFIKISRAEFRPQSKVVDVPDVLFLRFVFEDAIVIGKVIFPRLAVMVLLAEDLATPGRAQALTKQKRTFVKYYVVPCTRQISIDTFFN